MPYELTFTKPVEVRDREQYINECCVGGDMVVNQLLPTVKERFTDIDSDQEDWGWFIWFRKGKVKLAIDVFTDDPEEGAFRVHLTSRVPRLYFFNSVVDTPELEEVRELVLSELKRWTGQQLNVTRLDGAYM